VRWIGEWPSPKGRPDQQARQYEILYVALLDSDAPLGDRSEEGYLPAVLLCRGENKYYSVWPRYFVESGGGWKFGQDGPQLEMSEWEYLTKKVRSFASERGLPV
jgi:hypothetical protein